MRKTMYKVVEIDNGKLIPTYHGPEAKGIEYIIGKQYHQKVISGHKGGYYFFEKIEQAWKYKKQRSANSRIVECLVWGIGLSYEDSMDGKFCYPYFKIIKFADVPIYLQFESLTELIPKNTFVDESWFLRHFEKYPKGNIPEQTIEFIIDGKKIGSLNDKIKSGTIKELIKLAR